MTVIWGNLVFVFAMILSVRNSVYKEKFIQVGKWCFSFQLEYKDRQTSQNICKRSGGNLVWFDSKAKLRVVREYLEAGGYTKLRIQNREVLLNSYQRIKDILNYAERFCRIYKNCNMTKPNRELFMKNKKLPIVFDEENRANLTTPTGFSIEPSSIPGAGLGAWSKTHVRMFRVLGEYEGEEHTNDKASTNYQWNIFGHESVIGHYIDAASPAKSNWLRYVNCARNAQEENVKPVICNDLVFYMTSKEVGANTELLTWYGTDYGRNLGITRIHPGEELDLMSTFYIRLSHKPHRVSNESVDTYVTNSTDNFSVYDEKVAPTYIGMLDSFHGGKWKLVYENDYSFYADEGLLLPFICEYNQTRCADF